MAISKKKLYIVESPAKAKTIREYLGPEYLVEACFGHVLDLPEKKLGIKIKENFKPDFIVLDKKIKIVGILKSKAKLVSEIYLAGDSDREGEAICHELREILQDSSKKFYRVRFREVTRDAILSSLEYKEDINHNLVQSQITRRILDRLVGYLISPILWKKIGGALSAGRVQSVVLSWICKKESEINNFKSEEYFSLHALVETDFEINLRLELKKIKNEKAEIHTDVELKKILTDFEIDVNGKKINKNKKTLFEIIDIKKRIKAKNPPKPYITSSLQQDAFKFLNFSAKKTMKLAQELYEGMDLGKKGKSGVITYMRTDSTNISKEAQNYRKEFILKKIGENYLENNSNKSNEKKFAHEAIRPVDIFSTPDSLYKFLSMDQLKLYTLIWERFVASGMKPEITENLTLYFGYGDYVFQTTLNKILFDGFTKIILREKTKEFSKYDSLNLKVGDKVIFNEMQIEKKMTDPPIRYTESSLIRKMEKTGIGRPSTYAATLDVLRKRKYIDSKNRYIYPTALGIEVDLEMRKFFEKFTDEKFTASLEEKLDKIEKGELRSIDFLEEFYEPFSKMIKNAEQNIRSYETSDPNKEYSIKNSIICPICKSGKIVKKITRKGKLFYSCDRYPQCEFVSYDMPN